ncbi:UbiX family flavin prenyltransferase [Candidatus Bathyarchaeota archaeon]|nr:UbiX family flavin prenyltransferase [Candidatus Bathyarchaeota archaeon]
MKLVVAVTGASGAIYAKRLLQVLKEKNVEVHLIISDQAKIIAKTELNELFNYNEFAEKIYDSKDLTAPLSSGSFKIDGMVIIPASMKTIGAIASGFSENLITRAADVQLKERRILIIVPRETPLNTIHLRNMAKLSSLGAIILPAMPAFYHKPENIEELVDFVVGKILDQLGLEHSLYRRWGD